MGAKMSASHNRLCIVRTVSFLECGQNFYHFLWKKYQLNQRPECYQTATSWNDPAKSFLYSEECFYCFYAVGSVKESASLDYTTSIDCKL